MRDYDKEATQSESEGSDINESLGFSRKCAAHYKNPGENPGHSCKMHFWGRAKLCF